QTIPISSTSKKRLDEKNGKIVKDLSLQLENRNCVECTTRGPTYVDITTNSFCCSTCAGVLRGINPPHRIKSISMATFTCEEVETLKMGGNELNRRTWMGLHPGAQSIINFASKDDRTSFITDKYEKKKWYVSPEEVAKQKELLERAVEAKSEQLKMNNPRNESLDLFSSLPLGSNQSVRPPPSVSLDSVFAPPSMLSGISLDRVIGLDEPHPFSPPAFMAPPPPQSGVHPTSLPINQQPTHMPINFAFGSPPSGLISQSRQSVQVSPSPSSVRTPVDPFSPLTAMAKHFPKESTEPVVVPPPSSFLPPSTSFGTDPFGPSTTASTTGIGEGPFGAPVFSGFAIKFDEDTPTTSAPPSNPFDAFTTTTPNYGGSSSSPLPSISSISSIPSVPPPSSSTVDPLTSLVSLYPAAAAAVVPSVASPLPAVDPAMISTITPHGATSSSPSVPPVVSNNDADKYSALAELDELFHSAPISGDTSNGKPSWVSTGFSAPPPTASTGMAKSSTMGAISSISSPPLSSSSTITPSSSAFGGGIPSSSSSLWGVNNPNGSTVPFSNSGLIGSTGLGGVPFQTTPFPSMNTTAGPQSHYAQAAALTGNPFAPFPNHQAPHSQQSQQNPNWNPFL
ncbi:hypothetical protein PENTCL1PPCAC_26631, partial [Pristionchus entomophagus]